MAKGKRSNLKMGQAPPNYYGKQTNGDDEGKKAPPFPPKKGKKK